jgi:hypothetical protein
MHELASSLKKPEPTFEVAKVSDVVTERTQLASIEPATERTQLASVEPATERTQFA